MTSSMGVQVTPGQRCLLDLLQRKLLSTIQLYAKLSNQKQQLACNNDIDDELQRLKEKIRRISARQRRFTLEIINGNGNNTIPKESFFQALGLVTKEALNKLNSKSNERRRRTTANPRFSHEAIQAKRALEPLQKRIEPRLRDRREAAKKQARHPNGNGTDTVQNTGTSAASVGGRNGNNTNYSQPNNNRVGENGSNQQALKNNGATNNNSRSSGRSAACRNRNAHIHGEREEFLAKLGNLEKEINTKMMQIKRKRENNKKLEKQNEMIRKRGLDIINAINSMNPDLTFEDDNNQLIAANIVNNNNDSISNSNKNTSVSQTERASQPGQPLEIWIDMKCDESLDGLD